MATFMQAADRLPSLTGDQEKDVKDLHNYVYSLQEALRYTLANLGEDNFNDVELDNIREPVMIALESAKGELRHDLDVTAEELRSVIQTQTGQISAISQKADRIDLIVASGSSQTGVQLTPAALNAISQNITLSADQITMDGIVKFVNTGSGAYGATTIIGDYIDTHIIKADYLFGDYISIEDEAGNEYGYLTPSYNSDRSLALDVNGRYGIRVMAQYGNVYLGGMFDRANLTCWADGRLTMNGDSGIYANGNIIASSDREKKHDIGYDIAAYDALFDSLRPCRYKYNDGHSDRFHTGFIAQDVRAAVERAGLSTQDFAAYCAWEEDENKLTCGLRYEEFVALLVRQVQEIKKRMDNAGI